MSTVGLVEIGVWLANTGCVVDAVRRPESVWVAIDRRKSFWVTMLVMGSVLLLPIVVMLPAYVLGVWPLFDREAAVDEEFWKS